MIEVGAVNGFVFQHHFLIIVFIAENRLTFLERCLAKLRLAFVYHSHVLHTRPTGLGSLCILNCVKQGEVLWAGVRESK